MKGSHAVSVAKSWGYHFHADAVGGCRKATQDEEVIYRFTKDLVKRIDMVAFGAPWIHHFATHCPDKAGYSMCQMIETSNITAHFIDKDGNFYLDVFSCKPYDMDEVVAVIKEYFAPERMRCYFVHRNADAEGPPQMDYFEA